MEAANTDKGRRYPDGSLRHRACAHRALAIIPSIVAAAAGASLALAEVAMTGVRIQAGRIPGGDWRPGRFNALEVAGAMAKGEGW